jgi:hypothetical protein
MRKPIDEAVWLSSRDALSAPFRAQEACLCPAPDASLREGLLGPHLETPLREEVVKQIEIGLSESGIGSMDQLSEVGSEDQTTSRAHYLAYYRLRDTGWLMEETEKWRVYVDAKPRNQSAPFCPFTFSHLSSALTYRAMGRPAGSGGLNGAPSPLSAKIFR